MKTFLNREKPLLTNMIQVEKPDDFISIARTAVFEGAEAFGLQLERFDTQYRTEEVYKNMFYYTDDKPIYLTNYRWGYSENNTDDERAEELLKAVKCGGTLCDIMGDYFDPTPKELTLNEKAIRKQKELIQRFHEKGAEVLMSSHTFEFMTTDEVLKIALAHQERGADISKIVTASNTEEEMVENLKTTSILKKELDIPFLFLSVGPYCKLHRAIGPMLGSCMWLCVQRYDALATKDQLLLRAARDMRQSVDYIPHSVIS